MQKSSVVTASLVLLCVALVFGIVAAWRMGTPRSAVPVDDRGASASTPASRGEAVDTNKYKVQQAIEAERARNAGETTPVSVPTGAPASGNTSTPTGGNGAASGKTKTGYLLDGSDSRYIKKSELTGFTEEECRLARNEIYARHGRKFQDKAVQAYFDARDWYTPAIEADDFSEALLNAYETANRNLIVQYEKEKGYR